MVAYSYFIALILIVMVADPGLAVHHAGDNKCPSLGECGVRILTCIEKDKHIKCLRAIIDNENCAEETIDDATSLLIQMKDTPCEGSLEANGPTTNRDATTEMAGPVEEETSPPHTNPHTRKHIQTTNVYTFRPTEDVSASMERSENGAKLNLAGMLPIFLAVASVLLLSFA